MKVPKKDRAIWESKVFSRTDDEIIDELLLAKREELKKISELSIKPEEDINDDWYLSFDNRQDNNFSIRTTSLPFDDDNGIEYYVKRNNNDSRILTNKDWNYYR